jgi:hypothetical protein
MQVGDDDSDSRDQPDGGVVGAGDGGERDVEEMSKSLEALLLLESQS